MALIPYLINPTTEAATVVIETAVNLSRPGCLSVIGVLGAAETVAIQLPTVTEPASATDAHWTALMQDSEAVTLTAGHTAEAIPVGLTVRIVKPATANAVGLRWS